MKWELRNGNIITDKQMTQRRLDTADMYDVNRNSFLQPSITDLLRE